MVNDDEHHDARASIDDYALSLIQEGLRGVVRIPSGTAHALDSDWFPIPVMGKTGTTSEFKDALFVGSTYGVDGITVAVRVGFDDSHSLGRKETGGRVALPVFQELMLKVRRPDPRSCTVVSATDGEEHHSLLDGGGAEPDLTSPLDVNEGGR